MGETAKNVYAQNLIVVEMFLICSKISGLNFGFSTFFGGPWGFRKVRKVNRNKTPPILVPISRRGAELCPKSRKSSRLRVLKFERRNS